MSTIPLSSSSLLSPSCFVSITITVAVAMVVVSLIRHSIAIANGGDDDDDDGECCLDDYDDEDDHDDDDGYIIIISILHGDSFSVLQGRSASIADWWTVVSP